MVAGARSDHVRAFRDTILGYLFESTGFSGTHLKGGYGNTCRSIFDHCIYQSRVSGDDERRLQGIIPDGLLGASLPPGLLPSKLDGSRHLLELKTVSQRLSVEVKAGQIQRDLQKNARELGARDPRSTAHAEMMPYGIRGKYAAVAVGRFGEF
jgi:hypothetical protein